MRHTLGNGLTVILEEQHHAPVVAIQVWVEAGSADERSDEAGLAHLHEHMLFKGTARRGLGEIAKQVEARGGEINAWTSFDQTVYHVVLASSFFEDGLDILADAIQNPSFDPAELEREIEVVVEEIRRSEDIPARRLSRALFETAYRRHPYRLQVIGSPESVRSFDRARMLSFFREHYRPEQTVLSIVGDFQMADALARVERLFGERWRPQRDPAMRPPSAREVEPRQFEPRMALKREEVKEAHLTVAFHIPAISSPELPALDLLAIVLGQGEGARLRLGLELSREVASESYAYAYTPKDPGLFVTGATATAEQTAQALEALGFELARLVSKGVAEEELATAKALVEADQLHARETVQGVARQLGFYESSAGGVEQLERYLAAVAAATTEQLARAAKRYLTLENLTLAALLPLEISQSDAALLQALKSGFEAGSASAEAPVSGAPQRAEERPIPAAAPSRAARSMGRGEIESARLSNGVTVLVKREEGLPLFAVRAAYPGGLRNETDENNGINYLLSRLMTRATSSLSAAALAKEVDAMAGSLGGSAGRNSLGLHGEFRALHFDRAMELFAECLLTPSLADEDLGRERELLLQELHARDDNPASATFDLFSRTLFTRHPYRLDPLGSRASVAALDAAKIRALQSTYQDPSELTLTIVGKVEPDAAFARAERLFGGVPGARAAVPAVEQEPPQRQRRVGKRSLEKAQVHLVMGFPGLTLRSPERYSLDLLTSVLSGQGGRLFFELRDRRSLAYSVSAFSVEGIDPGYVGVYIGTSPEKLQEAIAGIEEQLERVTREELGQEELERARRYLLGTHAIGLQKKSARAALIAYDSLYGLGPANYLDYEAHLAEVTGASIKRVARELFSPERLTLAALGPESALCCLGE